MIILLAVWALSCEHMGLRSAFPHMGDMFEAQLWLRAILASMHKLKGQLSGCGGRGPSVRPVQVQLSMGEDIASFDSGAQKRVVPTSGVMYVDDQICLAIVCLAIHVSVRSHAAEGL